MQKLVDRCYNPHPAARIAGILDLTRVGLLAYKTQLLGKAQVAGRMLKAAEWREKNG